MGYFFDRHEKIAIIIFSLAIISLVTVKMTTQFHPQPPSPTLSGKVIVITGGALGVGAALVRLMHSSGAHVFFGDVLDEPGKKLEEELSSRGNSKIKFVHCDATSYAQNLDLFNAAYEACGRVDHAVANAGIGEQGQVFDPNLTLDSVKEEPVKGVRVLDINLKGEIYFARIASVYLRQPDVNGKNSTTAADKSLTLVSSVAGFREDPGLFVYIAAKHGVLGLMRSLRKCGNLKFSKSMNTRADDVFRSVLIRSSPNAIRTNAICPWMTRTRLTLGIEDAWVKAGLPSNTPEDVAKVIAGVMVDGEINGGTMYIEGGRAWNIEEGLLATRRQWLGEQREADLDRGTALMGGGEHWIENKKSQV